MESKASEYTEDIKPEVDKTKQICRCCLTANRRMKQIIPYASYFIDLIGLNVVQSDGLPQWLCFECALLLQKAVRFKHKIMKANSILHEYLTRCLPFPIDAQDPELCAYASPHLSVTATLNVDSTVKKKMGFSQELQHDKCERSTELDVLVLPAVVPKDDVKEEGNESDLEDNILLSEFRTNMANENPSADYEYPDLADDDNFTEIAEEKSSKKKTKKKEQKSKKKKRKDDDSVEPKSSIRKAVELDPTKIRIITLNPEEQIKQREEASKAGFKYPFQCNLCYKGFNFESKLQNHMSKHSPSRGKFECKLCHIYLPTAYSYSVHWLIHTQRYECVKCERRMTNRLSILDHYRSQHEGMTTLYTCQLCGKLSSNSKTHRGHMRNHHMFDRPKCDQCGKTFVNKDSLGEHMQIHQGIKNYECSICGKRVRTRTQLKQHQLIHSDVRMYYCVECDVRFKSSHGFRQHLRKSLKHQDTQNFKYSCSMCNKRYASAAAVAEHARVQHEGVRAHPCAECGAALATRNSLRKHVAAVHAGRRAPRTHVCHTCGKAFTGKSVLMNHVRTHTGEKPYSCQQCGRQFAQRTAMKTHVKLVHLKIRRTAKAFQIKPEVQNEVREPEMDLFSKEESSLVFDSWSRPPAQPCDMYFRVTAGP